MPHQEAGIDVLPDEALQHVLCFLPAREAVRTCVLARRWRHLWRSIPALRISSGVRKLSLSEQEFDTLDSFVNNLLFHRERSAPLELCEFGVHALEGQVNPQIDSWIQQALLCKAQTIRVDYYYHIQELSIDDLLISQHLTVLELSSVMLGSRFLDFSSCLALKELLIWGCFVDAEKISSRSLEQLTMRYCEFDEIIRTRISCPGLVRLELTENSNKTPFLDSMPLLVKAFVRLHGCDDRCDEVSGDSCSNDSCDNCVDNGDGITDSVLLKGLSEAESLELVVEPGMFIFQKDLMWCPTFSKLKTLLLNEWCVAIDFRAMVCFLQHTPVLEKLILQLHKAPNRWVSMKGSCNPSKRPFASKNLKLVEIKCEKFDKRVKNIFSILSTHGVCIEQIIVQQTQRSSECYSFQTNANLRWL